MKSLICYLSYSGNTKETSEFIKKNLAKYNISSDFHDIGYSEIPNFKSYDLVFIGTFTWGEGEVPEEILEFIEDNPVLEKIKNKIFIFGTGETQFGGDSLFCKAADYLNKYYNSPIKTLKIEQSPRGSQEKLIKKWVYEVIKHLNI